MQCNTAQGPLQTIGPFIWVEGGGGGVLRGDEDEGNVETQFFFRRKSEELEYSATVPLKKYRVKV